MSQFQSDHIKQFLCISLKHRLEVSRKIRNRYPNRIPIIIGRINRTNIGEINKHKFLVPSNITVGSLIIQLRKHIPIRSEEALFLFIRDTVLSSITTIEELDKKYVHEDGFLYISYAGENVFG